MGTEEPINNFNKVSDPFDKVSKELMPAVSEKLLPIEDLPRLEHVVVGSLPRLEYVVVGGFPRLEHVVIGGLWMRGGPTESPKAGGLWIEGLPIGSRSLLSGRLPTDSPNTEVLPVGGGGLPIGRLPIGRLIRPERGEVEEQTIDAEDKHHHD